MKNAFHKLTVAIKPEVWERIGWTLLVCLLLGGLPVALYRALSDNTNDFTCFHQAGRYVLEHGARDPESGLSKYLPSADVAWMALGWMPLGLAAIVWYLIGVGSWFGLLRAIGRYLLADLEPVLRRRTVLVAGLLAALLAIDGFCLGSFHVFMVWFMVAGLGRIAQNRNWSGGGLLGLAIWIKLLPLLGVALLLWKRKWLPAAVALACMLLVDVTLSVGGLAPKAAWNEHVNWLAQEGCGSTSRQLNCVGCVDEDRPRNQSTVAVLRRLLTKYGNQINPVRHSVILAKLSPRELTGVYLAVVGLLGLAVAVFCRRAGRATSGPQWSAEIALVALTTLWVSPVVWSYHSTAAAPALAVVLGKSQRSRWLAWLVIVVWMLGVCLLGSPLARACGSQLWINLLLGLALLWVSRQLRQQEIDRQQTPSRVFSCAVMAPRPSNLRKEPSCPQTVLQ